MPMVSMAFCEHPPPHKGKMRHFRHIFLLNLQVCRCFINAGSSQIISPSSDRYPQRFAGKKARAVVFTGAIDAYFNHRYGKLEYRSLRFEEEILDTPNYQGVAIVNYTNKEIPYTRIVEHKHFEFGEQPVSVISREYPASWNENREPYYPVNTPANNTLYNDYLKLSCSMKDVFFGGRLGEYAYYDMDKIVSKALNRYKDIKKRLAQE